MVTFIMSVGDMRGRLCVSLLCGRRGGTAGNSVHRITPTYCPSTRDTTMITLHLHHDQATTFATELVLRVEEGAVAVYISNSQLPEVLSNYTYALDIHQSRDIVIKASTTRHYDHVWVS